MSKDWKLVPVEPTTEMKIAGDNAGFWCGDKYRAMIDAAPSAPAVDAGALQEIASALTVMMMSAKCFVDTSDDDAVIGYRIKTGAIHKVIGILACAGHPVSIPSNMPLADDDREFTNAAEWTAHYLPNDFVLGDNTRRIAEVVTPESVRKAMRLDEIVTAPPPASTNRLTDEQLDDFYRLACEQTDDWCERQEREPTRAQSNALFIRNIVALIAATESPKCSK